MDRIIIRDLAVFYRVGVPEIERAAPQRLLVSLEMEHDFGAAAAADDLVQTINYSVVCQRLLRFGEGRAWKLIETLAVDIAHWLHAEFGVRAVEVEIKKFAVPDAAYVAVRLARTFQPATASDRPLKA